MIGFILICFYLRRLVGTTIWSNFCVESTVVSPPSTTIPGPLLIWLFLTLMTAAWWTSFTLRTAPLTLLASSSPSPTLTRLFLSAASLSHLGLIMRAFWVFLRLPSYDFVFVPRLKNCARCVESLGCGFTFFPVRSCLKLGARPCLTLSVLLSVVFPRVIGLSCWCLSSAISGCGLMRCLT